MPPAHLLLPESHGASPGAIWGTLVVDACPVQEHRSYFAGKNSTYGENMIHSLALTAGWVCMCPGSEMACTEDAQTEWTGDIVLKQRCVS
jgi:hypothetical protein